VYGKSRLFRSAKKTSVLGVTPRKALTRARHHESVRFDSFVREKKMVSIEMSQTAGNESAGLTDMELTSLVPPLQNHVLPDHESRPPPAAGTDRLFRTQLVGQVVEFM
jgi:hypothetical protein